MTRADIEQLQKAFSRLDDESNSVESARGRQLRAAAEYEQAMERYQAAKATVDALCIKLGVDPGAPSPFGGVPHPRSTPSGAAVP